MTPTYLSEFAKENGLPKLPWSRGRNKSVISADGANVKNIYGWIDYPVTAANLLPLALKALKDRLEVWTPETYAQARSVLEMAEKAGIRLP